MITGSPEDLRRRYKEQRDFCLSVLGEVCIKCGSIDGLQIDHIDPATKTMKLGILYGLNRRREIIKELKKCQLLCRVCHGEKTGKENSVRMLEPGFTHGTFYGWTRRKCKCIECETARRKYYDERNIRRRKNYAGMS